MLPEGNRPWEAWQSASIKFFAPLSFKKAGVGIGFAYIMGYQTPKINYMEECNYE